MGRYAVIEDGVVDNVVKAEPDFAVAQGWIEAPSHVSIGWIYTDGVWAEPVEPELTAEERMVAAAKECSRRIYAIADSTAQMNMASAASAGLMSADQMDAWKQALFWVNQMRGTWRDLAADTTKDIADDANWPECPADAVALATSF